MISDLLRAITDKDVEGIATILTSKEIAYSPAGAISDLVWQPNPREADAAASACRPWPVRMSGG